MAVSNRSIINLGVSEIQAENIGAGNGVFAQKVSGNTLQFKTLLAGSNINLTTNPSSDEIIVSASVTAISDGVVTGATFSGSVLQLKRSESLSDITLDFALQPALSGLTPSFGTEGVIQLSDGNGVFSGDTGLTYNFSGQTLELNNLKFNNQPSLDEEGRYLLVYDPVTGLIKTFDTMATERIERAGMYTDTTYNITIDEDGSSDYSFIYLFGTVDDNATNTDYNSGNVTDAAITADTANGYIKSRLTGNINLYANIVMDSVSDSATAYTSIYKGDIDRTNLIPIGSGTTTIIPTDQNPFNDYIIKVSHTDLHTTEDEVYYLGIRFVGTSLGGDISFNFKYVSFQAEFTDIVEMI